MAFRLIVASTVFFMSIAYAVNYSDSVLWQAFLVTLGLQFSLQIAFRFIPNTVKVFATALVLVSIIRLLKKMKEGFCCIERPRMVKDNTVEDNDDDCDDDCWEDPQKRANRNVNEVLTHTASVTRDIERFLNTNETDLLQS